MIESNFFFLTFFRESEEQIKYLEKNFLKPLKDAEEKSGKILLQHKSREVLHKIFGIIETNALYLTSFNEIAGKNQYSKKLN